MAKCYKLLIAPFAKQLNKNVIKNGLGQSDRIKRHLLLFEYRSCAFWSERLTVQKNYKKLQIELRDFWFYQTTKPRSISGDNGWLGLDWLGSIKDVFETQMSDLRSNETDDKDWTGNDDENDEKEDKILPPVRVGGLERLRVFKCTL
jgi:hypothetical protein